MSKTAIFSLVVLLLSLIPIGLTQDVTFNKCRYSSLKQPWEVPIVLTITDSTLLIQGKQLSKKIGPVDFKIPYSAIDSMSYAFASRHRVDEGSALMGLSLAGGAILMATKTKSYWLRVDYHDGDGTQSTILRLDKSEYQEVISALEKKSGKQIPNLDAKTSPSLLNPTVGSKDTDALIPFGRDAVVAALKQAMEAVGCKVKEGTSDRVRCKRVVGRSERTGSGGEKITATLEPSGDQTHIRIWTGKKFVDQARKVNWSTPVYQEMMSTLHKTVVASKAN